MSEQQQQINLGRKMKNKAIVHDFVNFIMNHCVKNQLIVEYGDGIYLSPNDSQRADELKMTVKLIDSKIAHYKGQRRKAINKLSNMTAAKNLKDHVFRTVGSNVLNLIQPNVLSDILSCTKDEQDVFAMIERIKSVTATKNSKTECTFDISDTDQTVVEETEEDIEIARRMKSQKRKRVQSKRKGQPKKSRTEDSTVTPSAAAETVFEDLQCSSDDE